MTEFQQEEFFVQDWDFVHYLYHLNIVSLKVIPSRKAMVWQSHIKNTGQDRFHVRTP